MAAARRSTRGLMALAAAAACASLAPAAAHATSTKAEIEESVTRGVGYLKSLQLASGGFESDWALSALAADGVAAANVQKSGAATSARTWYRELVGNETATKWPAKAVATEYARGALNAYAAGIEPARVSATQNLIAAILSFYQPEHPGYYGEPEVFEGTIFGLLALANAKTEEGVQRVPQPLLEQSIATIEANQHTDGGWNFQKAEGNETVRKAAAEPDTTGAAIAALCAAGVSPVTNEAVKKGLAYLKSLLVSSSGAFQSEFGANTDSNGWGVSGLNACGINPQEEGFTTAGKKTPIDFLISQQLAGGGFKYLTSGTTPNELASQDAVRALAGAGFTSVPPVPSGGLEQWFAASSFSTGKSVKSPLGVVINNGTGTLKACSVSVAPEATTTTLEAVLQAAEAGSTPTGCVTGHASEASTGAITQINGSPAAPAPEWEVSINGSAPEPARTSTVIHLGDTIYLTLEPNPVLTSLSSAEGPPMGGTAVTITGANLTGTKQVKFGSAQATSVEVLSATSIRAVSPAGAGTVNVTVTTGAGTSAVTPADEFAYEVSALLEFGGLRYATSVQTGKELAFAVPSAGSGFTLGPLAVDGASGETAQVRLNTQPAFEEQGPHHYRASGRGIASTATAYNSRGEQIIGPLPVACTAPPAVVLGEAPIATASEGSRSYSVSFEAECVLAPGVLDELTKSKVTITARGPERFGAAQSVDLTELTFAITPPVAWRETLLAIGANEVRGRSGARATTTIAAHASTPATAITARRLPQSLWRGQAGI